MLVSFLLSKYSFCQPPPSIFHGQITEREGRGWMPPAPLGFVRPGIFLAWFPEARGCPWLVPEEQQQRWAWDGSQNPNWGFCPTSPPLMPQLPHQHRLLSSAGTPRPLVATRARCLASLSLLAMGICYINFKVFNKKFSVVNFTTVWRGNPLWWYVTETVGGQCPGAQELQLLLLTLPQIWTAPESLRPHFHCWQKSVWHLDPITSGFGYLCWFVSQQQLEPWVSLSLSRHPGVPGLQKEGWRPPWGIRKAQISPQKCSAAPSAPADTWGLLAPSGE